MIKLSSIPLLTLAFLSILDASQAWSNHLRSALKCKRTEPTGISNPVSLLRAATSDSSSGTGIEFTVKLGLPPLGIVFEEVEPIGYAGVQVISLVTGGKGEQCKKIQIGDRLKSTTAIKFISGSSNYQVVVVDCQKLDFDTIISAIGSNQERFRVDSVELTFSRLEEAK
eukprot:CAMPEP_0172430800 /NCGR_PEP_ID=MMETSP1064-20121228/56096_1 /TAXON_ID=202472 /ORGANISM="Aulacoseira subarctica , Strain CCAP 1002/5" /LENGTH=168 /DNA_ID=CAMNT_0013177143 /DNA_START=54 /DNA_END=560 /DNA_ORIENTATION=-